MRKRLSTNSQRNSNELLSLSSKHMTLPYEHRILPSNQRILSSNHQEYLTPRNPFFSLSEERRNVIPLTSEIELFHGSWRMNSNSQYFISTGFTTSTLSIISSSGIDSVSITCLGVKTLSVTCVEQRDESLTARSSEQRREVLEASISQVTAVDHLEDFPLQQINLRTPWPCSHLEASFVPLEGSFISILQILTYCDSMPSSMSTPIK